MYTKILVPLDGSPLAESVLPYVRTLAKGLGAKAELLHVVDPQVITTFVDPHHGRYVDIVEADIKNNGLDYLEPLAGSLPDPSQVECSVEIGHAAEVIVKRAETRNGTLIAMATHGLSGVRRWLLGSVADKVLHRSTRHLLLVRPKEKADSTGLARLKTLVVPLDGSSLAERVLPYVASLVKKMGLEVILLRAYALPLATYFVGEDYPPPDLEQFREQVRDEAKRYLEAKAAQLNSEGLERVSYMVPEGNAAQEIIEAAEQIRDNLVAMGTHGWSGLGRWVLGSVTSRVVDHSGDPVLVIRASDGRE